MDPAAPPRQLASVDFSLACLESTLAGSVSKSAAGNSSSPCYLASEPELTAALQMVAAAGGLVPQGGQGGAMWATLERVGGGWVHWWVVHWYVRPAAAIGVPCLHCALRPKGHPNPPSDAAPLPCCDWCSGGRRAALPASTLAPPSHGGLHQGWR